MNFIFISPNFPIRNFKWVEALKGHGINVLAIGDSPHWDLHPRLRNAAREYYFVPDLSDYGKVLEGCRYFERKYGKIHYIESNNEWWLTLDARLRKDLGVTTGFWPEDMDRIKAKSEMKECFRRGGAKTMRFLLVNGPEDIGKALSFAREVGFPVFVKPNVGVGASDSFSLKDEEAVASFLKDPLSETYIMEEYIEGTIVSYDGFCDSKGEVAFRTSDHFPVPVADVVNENVDDMYYTNPFSLPFHDVDREEFDRVGRGVVKAFGIKTRPFHIEFFLLSKDRPGLARAGEFVGLECNMRTPGGYTPDLIDFAHSVSCYEIYADLVAYDENRQDMGKEKYYAFACSRKDVIRYARTQGEIMARYNQNITMMGRYPEHLALAMGDEYYYAKFKTYEEGIAFDRFVRERARD